jgi:hypothetical protein
MNIFNRIILVMVLLGLILVVTAVFIFPDQILVLVGQFLVDWGQYFTWVDQEQQLFRLGISIFLAAIIDLILVLLIFLEIKPKRQRFIKVEQVNGGNAKVSLDSITRQLLYRLDPLPGVIKVTPTIRPKGNKIQAMIDVTVTRELAVPQMADRLIITAKQAVGEDLGLVLVDAPQIRIKVVDIPQRSPAAYLPQPVQGKSMDETPPPLPVTTPSTAESRPALPLPFDEESEKEKNNWA